MRQLGFQSPNPPSVIIELPVKGKLAMACKLCFGPTHIHGITLWKCAHSTFKSHLRYYWLQAAGTENKERKHVHYSCGQCDQQPTLYMSDITAGVYTMWQATHLLPHVWHYSWGLYSQCDEGGWGAVHQRAMLKHNITVIVTVANTANRKLERKNLYIYILKTH